MKKTLIINIIFIILIAVIIPSKTQAFSLTEIFQSADNFVKEGGIPKPILDKEGNPQKDENGNIIYQGISSASLSAVIVPITQTLLIIANIIIVIVGLIIGIKYLVSSVDEKAQLKKSLVRSGY